MQDKNVELSDYNRNFHREKEHAQTHDTQSEYQLY